MASFPGKDGPSLAQDQLRVRPSFCGGRFFATSEAGTRRLEHGQQLLARRPVVPVAVVLDDRQQIVGGLLQLELAGQGLGQLEAGVKVAGIELQLALEFRSLGRALAGQGQGCAHAVDVRVADALEPPSPGLRRPARRRRPPDRPWPGRRWRAGWRDRPAAPPHRPGPRRRCRPAPGFRGPSPAGRRPGKPPRRRIPWGPAWPSCRRRPSPGCRAGQPMNPSTGRPSTKANTAGFDCTRSWPAWAGFLAISTFTSPDLALGGQDGLLQRRTQAGGRGRTRSPRSRRSPAYRARLPARRPGSSRRWRP